MFRCHTLFIFFFMMFLNHLDDDGQGNDERSIHSRRNIDGIAVAEKRELAANLCHQVAIAITHAEIPAPNVPIDVEDHTITALNLKAFAKQAELLVHTGPVLPIAITFIARQKREYALLDMYQFLARIAIKHDQVITDAKEFATHLKHGIACLIANNESFRQAPRSLSNMVTQIKSPPISIFVSLKTVLRYMFANPL